MNSLELLDSYQRYLLKGLQAEFGFHGMSVRLLLRRADNPYKVQTTVCTVSSNTMYL
jgi:predicted GTPase